MPQALRLTDKTKFKIAQQFNIRIEDVQAYMEYYGNGIIRPYALINLPLFGPLSLDQDIMPDSVFQAKYRFVDEEDPYMFREVTLR